MKLSGEGGMLILELSELGVPGAPADDDVLLNVTVEVSGFTAADQSWITASDWHGFLSELASLEHDRRGHARLVGASPDDLRLEFYSTDRAGHMAVRGELRRVTAQAFELGLRFGFSFEPDDLPRILRELGCLSAR